MTTESTDTKELILKSFMDLMLEVPFEKITIKMITKRAGIIRPTFYNHFQDKYELFDVILQQDLFDTLYNLVDMDLYSESIKVIFTYFEKNKEFYRNSFEITGQDSFEETFTRKLIDFQEYILNSLNLDLAPQIAFLEKRQIAQYYALGIISVIKSWLLNRSPQAPDADSLVIAYQFLITHSIYDIFDKNRA